MVIALPRDYGSGFLHLADAGGIEIGYEIGVDLGVGGGLHASGVVDVFQAHGDAVHRAEDASLGRLVRPLLGSTQHFLAVDGNPSVQSFQGVDALQQRLGQRNRRQAAVSHLFRCFRYVEFKGLRQGSPPLNSVH